MATETILVLIARSLHDRAVQRNTRNPQLRRPDIAGSGKASGRLGSVRRMTIGARRMAIAIQNNSFVSRMWIIGIRERVCVLTSGIELRQYVQERLREIVASVVAFHARLREIIDVKRAVRILSHEAVAKRIVSRMTTGTSDFADVLISVESRLWGDLKVRGRMNACRPGNQRVFATVDSTRARVMAREAELTAGIVANQKHRVFSIFILIVNVVARPAFDVVVDQRDGRILGCMR